MISRPIPKQTTQKQRLLRCADAARYLGVGTKRIRQLIVSGELAYVQFKAKNSPFLVDLRDLDHLIEARKSRASM